MKTSTFLEGLQVLQLDRLIKNNALVAEIAAEQTKMQANIAQAQLELDKYRIDIAKKKLIQQKINNMLQAEQLKIQEFEKLHQQQQKELKNSFFLIKTELENALNKVENIVKYIYIVAIENDILKYELDPNYLDDLNDKEYAYNILKKLDQAKNDVKNNLNNEENNDLEFIERNREERLKLNEKSIELLEEIKYLENQKLSMFTKKISEDKYTILLKEQLNKLNTSTMSKPKRITWSIIIIIISGIFYKITFYVLPVIVFFIIFIIYTITFNRSKKINKIKKQIDDQEVKLIKDIPTLTLDNDILEKKKRIESMNKKDGELMKKEEFFFKKYLDLAN